MIEKVEELGAKLEFHGFTYGDGLCHIEFPLLLARTTSLDGVAAQVAEESADVRARAGSADGEGVRPGSAEGVESGNGRAGRVDCCGSEYAGVVRGSRASELLRIPRLP